MGLGFWLSVGAGVHLIQYGIVGAVSAGVAGVWDGVAGVEWSAQHSVDGTGGLCACVCVSIWLLNYFTTTFELRGFE